MEVILKLPNNQPFPIKCSQNKESNTSLVNELSSLTSNFIFQDQDKIVIKPCFWMVVPNIIRYKFRFENNGFTPIPISNKIHTKSNYYEKLFEINDFRKIVIVLESPHVDEYTSDMQPISPAQANTGTKINSNIEDLLENINSRVHFKQNEVIEIALVNPIPLQTSLGTIHNKRLKGKYSTLRNNVWRGIWENTDYKEDFINLINSLSPEDIIINACTADLKNSVRQAISKASNQNKNIVESYHPSATTNWVSTLKEV